MTVTECTTAAELIALSPADREAAYVELREWLAEEYPRINACSRRLDLEARHGYHNVGRTRAELAERCHVYDALAHRKALLACLTGRSAGYAPRLAQRGDMEAVEAAMRAEGTLAASI